MTISRLLPSLSFALALAVGCSSAPTDIVPSGLQYSGAVVPPQGDAAWLELSAPLFPDAVVFQQFQDPSLYAGLSDAERVALIDDDVRVFEDLLTLCAADYPAITLQTEGGPALDSEQIKANYDEVARCGYELYGAKPYWVPHHVSDVDVCARKLGADWRLPTEDDVLSWTEDDLQFFQDTLTVPDNGEFPEHFYYSLDIYVRASDGSLALGNLAPGADHVTPLPVSGADLDALYIGNGRPIGLRCVRGLDM